MASQLISPRRQVLASHHHVRMPVEHLEHVLFGVLAAQAEQHAAATLSERELLQGAPRRVDDDAKRPILADDSAPQRLVTVHHHDLQGRGFDSPELADDRGPERRVERRGVRHVAVGNCSRIVESFDLVRREQGVSLQNVHSCERGQTRCEFRFRALSPFLRRLIAPGSARERAEDDQEGCLQPRSRSRGDELLDPPLESGRPVLAATRSKTPVVESDGDDVEPRRIPGHEAGRIEQLLEHLVVSRELHVDRQIELLPPRRRRRPQGAQR